MLKSDDSDENAKLKEYADICDSLEVGDRIRFNDRKLPLEVKRISKSGSRLYIYIEGAHGGHYKLSTERKNRGWHRVSLQQETGYSDKGFPTYDTIQINHLEIVDSITLKPGMVFKRSLDNLDFYKIVRDKLHPHELRNGDQMRGVTVTVKGTEVINAEKCTIIPEILKSQYFDGDIEMFTDIPMDNRANYIDYDQAILVRLVDPHTTGVDVRPLKGTGLEVVDWETVLFNLESRFELND